MVEKKEKGRKESRMSIMNLRTKPGRASTPMSPESNTGEFTKKKLLPKHSEFPKKLLLPNLTNYLKVLNS